MLGVGGALGRLCCWLKCCWVSSREGGLSAQSGCLSLLESPEQACEPPRPPGVLLTLPPASVGHTCSVFRHRRMGRVGRPRISSALGCRTDTWCSGEWGTWTVTWPAFP